MSLGMARIFGIVLVLLAIWYGVSTYLGATQSQAAAAAATAENPAASDPAASASADQPSGAAAPTAITSRVRDRVTAAMEQGYHRDTDE
jgi:hypothetical protein